MIVADPATARRFQTRHHPTGDICHHYEIWSLTCDQFDDMRDRAGYCCEICRIPEARAYRGRLLIDHVQADSWKGIYRSYIRGLLCHRCKSLMARVDGNKPWGAKRGQFGIEFEAAAIAYAANSWQMPDGTIRPRLVAAGFDRFKDWT